MVCGRDTLSEYLEKNSDKIYNKMIEWNLSMRKYYYIMKNENDININWIIVKAKAYLYKKLNDWFFVIFKDKLKYENYKLTIDRNWKIKWEIYFHWKKSKNKYVIDFQSINHYFIIYQKVKKVIEFTYDEWKTEYYNKYVKEIKNLLKEEWLNDYSYNDKNRLLKYLQKKNKTITDEILSLEDYFPEYVKNKSEIRKYKKILDYLKDNK